MMLELNREELLALHSATQDSEASYVAVWPDEARRPANVIRRLDMLRALRQRLVTDPDGGMPPDLREGASM